MYKIMIIEDEQIERETLYKIIQEDFRNVRSCMLQKWKRSADAV